MHCWRSNDIFSRFDHRYLKINTHNNRFLLPEVYTIFLPISTQSLCSFSAPEKVLFPLVSRSYLSLMWDVTARPGSQLEWMHFWLLLSFLCLMFSADRRQQIPSSSISNQRNLPRKNFGENKQSRCETVSRTKPCRRVVCQIQSMAPDHLQHVVLYQPPTPQETEVTACNLSHTEG